MDVISRVLSLAWEVTDCRASTASDASTEISSDNSDSWESNDALSLDSEKACSEAFEAAALRAHPVISRGQAVQPVRLGPSAGSWARSRSRWNPGALRQAVVMFDWDDTLMPTRFVRAVVEPTLPEARAPVPPDSPFFELLRQHGELVADTLRAARAVSRVAIVTLSSRPWVHTSAAQFLPGLDLPQLLSELEIPIYYAAEHVRSTLARIVRSDKLSTQQLSDGVDVQAACKRAAMAKGLREVCAGRRLHLNVLSVGDSTAEQKALKDVLWSPQASQLPRAEHLCKTVKFTEEPTVGELSRELRLTAAMLPDILAHHKDIDLAMANVEDVPLLAEVPPFGVGGSFGVAKGAQPWRLGEA